MKDRIASILLFVYLFSHLCVQSRDLPQTCNPESYLNHLRKATWTCSCEPLGLTQGDENKKSIITMEVPGRLGNRMLIFSLMLALKRAYGSRVYLQSNVLEDVNNYFPRALQIPSIENNFCMPPDKWETRFPHLQELNSTLYHGQIILLWPNLRLMDSTVNDKLKMNNLLSMIEPELRETFVFREEIQAYARNMLLNAVDAYKEELRIKQKKKPKNLDKLNVTLVGVHVRKRDAQELIVERYNLPKLSPSYYLEAMHMYKNKFKHVVFVVVSDEMKWVHEHIIPRRSSAFIYAAGFGHVNCRTSIALDLALLGACHHTILSYGTFSFWGGWLSGGYRVLPNHVFDVTPMDDPFKNTLNSFRLPDYGVSAMSDYQKKLRRMSSFTDL